MIGNWIEGMLRRIPRLPRKWRVVRNLICSVLFLLFIWYALETPSLTALGAFRRAEQANLMGPTEIVYRTKDDQYTYFFGKGKDGYLVGRSRFSLGLGDIGWDGYVTYWEKTGGATLLPLGYRAYVEDDRSRIMMLLFHELPDAARGEAVLTITGEGEAEGIPYTFNESYTIEFEPAGDGVLTGWLNAKTPDADSWEGRLERYRLGSLFYGDATSHYPVVIRLYDSNGNVIYEAAGEYFYMG